jgi:uncharacterized protein (TIGR03492 family)
MSDASGAPDILLVSNGFGEAAVAQYIARAIAAGAPAARLEHLPLVSASESGGWPPQVGPRRAMPSGGLVANWNVRQLLRDLIAGLGPLTIEQVRYLRKQAQRDAIVAVGDIYCLTLSLLSRRPAFFVATAKSQLVAPHSRLEVSIARRAAAAFARDQETADALSENDVRARYAGNVMMDGLVRSNADLMLDGSALKVGVLPGSRADAAVNAGEMTKRISAFARMLAPSGRRVQALVSLAPSLASEPVRSAIDAAGFILAPVQPDGSRSGAIARHTSDNLTIVLIKGAFADIIYASDIVFGQAGTANEQAAGLGRPVLAAAEPGERPQRMHWYRMRQKRLLGDALLVLDSAPDEFAAGAVRVLQDPALMEHMAETGRLRMGQPGGAAAVAAAVLSEVSRP